MTPTEFLHILPTTTTLCRYVCILSSQLAPATHNSRGLPRGIRKRLGEVAASGEQVQFVEYTARSNRPQTWLQVQNLKFSKVKIGKWVYAECATSRRQEFESNNWILASFQE